MAGCLKQRRDLYSSQKALVILVHTKIHTDALSLSCSLLGDCFLPAIYWHLSTFQQHMDTKFNAATFESDAFYTINISHL